MSEKADNPHVKNGVPERVLDYIREKSRTVDWGSIVIELNQSGYMDVTVQERIRFSVPDRILIAHKGPRAGKVVSQ